MWAPGRVTGTSHLAIPIHWPEQWSIYCTTYDAKLQQSKGGKDSIRNIKKQFPLYIHLYIAEKILQSY